MHENQRAGQSEPGLCAEHGGLMWSNAMRACITPDDVIRGGCRWQPFVARALVDQQAEDEGLWFDAQTVPEAYLQQELRRLHAAIEGDESTWPKRCRPCGVDIADEKALDEHVQRGAMDDRRQTDGR